MSAGRRGVLFVLTVLTIATVGGIGADLISTRGRPTWPGRVAVVGVDDKGTVRTLAVADPNRRAVVTVPISAVVEVPGSGFLRAFQAYRIGGAGLARETLALLFGVDVPFVVVGEGQGAEQVVQNIVSVDASGEEDVLTSALQLGVGSWIRKDVRVTEVGGAALPDPASVNEAARQIGGLGTRIFAEPPPSSRPAISSAPVASAEASPSPGLVAPSSITVDVLNGGDTSVRSAAITAERLVTAGFVVKKKDNFKESRRPASVIYAKPGAEAKAERVADLLGYPVADLPDGIETTSDVVVVLGLDAPK